jgi:beta-lactamase superfamily II metal-dependent hydrolase
VSQLTITAYNVRFGDAILITIPDRSPDGEVVRHILIDFGNVLTDTGEKDQIFHAVASNILKRLDGRTLDLYIMTHEHMDHVGGLPHARNLGLDIPVDYAWLTASARLGYYGRFPEAKKRLDLCYRQYEQIHLAVKAQGLLAAAPIRAFLENNHSNSTSVCVDYLRNIAAKKASYVHRTFRLIPGRHHPFNEARLSIWAPELDTTLYYRRMKPLVPSKGNAAAPRLRPPPGVDPNGFRKLILFLEHGIGDNILAIDQAANNTSLVFALEWRGWRLLFLGDAELKSWLTMSRHRQLKPVHFVKVSHHASQNGTPPDQILERILPLEPRDDRPRSALISTWPDTYSGVPDELTIRRLQSRVDGVYSTSSKPAGGYVEIAFAG